MNFRPGITATPGTESASALWVVFHNNNLLVTKENLGQLPTWKMSEVREQLTMFRYLGTLDGRNCYTGQWNREDLPEELTACNLRQLYGKLEEGLFQLAGRAAHLNYWAANHCFCGRCGAATVDSTEELARVCTVCGFVIYPRIAPAIIVAVVREGQILLARGIRFTGCLYSVIAGFVEPGETLEECVRREIREETGVEVCNIRYFASQPWPFPDSLMVAYTAEYAGGELVIDPKELVAAGWFGPENLPEVPGKMSIARALIDWFVQDWAAKGKRSK